MANTPIDFLLEGSDATLVELYVGAGEPLPRVPEHDVAMVAIGESETSAPVLNSLSRMLAQWPRPVINRNVEKIVGLSRDGVAAMFAGSAHVLAPATERVGRADVERMAAGEAPLSSGAAALAYPLIIRPVGSHAGEGLLRIDAPSDFKPYLAASRALEFYLAPYVDYAGPDGLYRKYRIAVIDGRAYLSHLAISGNWMVHYLSAGMAEDPAKRAEEAEAMANFDQGFGARQAAALAEIQATLGLDYYALDCAETKDGKLLLFEADVAMIVHAMDDAETFPYKQPQMRKIFDAFQALLKDRASR
jgi:hypothetical protein